VLACLAVACAGPASLISVEQEIEVGREIEAQVRSQTARVRDPDVTAYIAGLGRRLVEAAGGSDYPYSFSIADYREINAFALPGGPVWIHRGVLHAATNEAQVAGVLAHEVAHIERRHAASRLTQVTLTNWGLGLLGAMLGNSGGASAAQTAAQALANGVFLKFSRDDEREADRLGLRMLMDAGWDGRGMTEMFEILRTEAARDPSQVEVFFSSHPAPAERISGLREAAAGARRGVRDTPAFAAIKARLLKMQPPASMHR
jgi:predicted Zn-dependent protease